MWLWCKPTAAALIQPLALELPYTAKCSYKKKKKKNPQSGQPIKGAKEEEKACILLLAQEARTLEEGLEKETAEDAAISGTRESSQNPQ